MNFKDYIFILTLFTILVTCYFIPTSKPEFLEVCVEEEIIPVYIKSEYELFLDAIGHQESGNRYNIVNRYGYMGKISIW